MPDPIIEQLHARRIALGMTYRELAGKVGTSASTAHAYLAGTKAPSLPVLRRLADALGVEITTIQQ